MLAPIFRYLYKHILKPVFFIFDPEAVHDFITWVGEHLGRWSVTRQLTRSFFDFTDASLQQNLWGLNFRNPVGLSAGFDKDGRLYSIMRSVGFGFAEIGTVTFRPYEGNPGPRLYRLPKSRGLVVYYGLKNRGAAAVKSLLAKRRQDIPRVISIGRTNSKLTAAFADGLQDYEGGFREFIGSGVGEIYEINISCPNTFGGEPFADPKSLHELLSKIFALPIDRPVFVKMPINLAWPEFQALLDVILRFPVAAVTIGNLNKDRNHPDIKDMIPAFVKGNISGRPTTQLSNELIGQTFRYCGDRLKIIGVGGIMNAEDAYQKIRLGASLVELITGLIYEGPQLVGEINQGLVKLLKRDGFKNISEAVGADLIQII